MGLSNRVLYDYPLGEDYGYIEGSAYEPYISTNVFYSALKSGYVVLYGKLALL